MRSEIGGESEGLGNGEVSLDGEHGGSGPLLLSEDVSTTPVKDSVDSSDGVLRALDLDEVDGLEETGGGEQLRCVTDSATDRDDLTTSTVNGIGVESNIEDVESDGTHVLLADGTLLGGPLEGGDTRVLDLSHELNSLGGVNEQVGT